MGNLTPREQEDSDELDEISRHAVEETLKVYPSREEKLSVWSRIGLIIAVVVVAGNAFVSIYNSLALHQEVSCNHQLTVAIAQVGDQNRSINKTLFDALVSNEYKDQPLTASVRKQLANYYNANYAINTTTRAEVLGTTCSDGASPPKPTPSPSRT
jgi:hypothetical protein